MTQTTITTWARRVGLLATALSFVACGGEGGHGWNPLKTESSELRDGIKDFNDSKWADAEKKFSDANNKEPTSEGHFDEGSALYRQKKTADAAEQLRKVLSSTDDDLKERAYFNLGNAEASAGELEKAKENYRRALELRPHDADARYNLEWASRTIEQKKEQAKNDQKGGQKDPKDSKDDKKDDKKDEKKDDQKQAQNDKDKKDDQKKDDPGKKEDPEAKNDKKDQQDKDGQPKDDQKDKGDQKEAQNDQKEPDKDKPGQDPQKGQQGESKDEKQQQGTAGAQAGDKNDKEKQPARPMTQQETASVLKALEAGEKSLQMWKFDQKQNRPRTTIDKDW